PSTTASHTLNQCGVPSARTTPSSTVPSWIHAGGFHAPGGATACGADDAHPPMTRVVMTRTARARYRDVVLTARQPCTRSARGVDAPAGAASSKQRTNSNPNTRSPLATTTARNGTLPASQNMVTIVTNDSFPAAESTTNSRSACPVTAAPRYASPN